MAKKKFVEKRRIERTTERETAVDPRDYRNTLSSMLSGMEVQFETHGTGIDDYDGFKLSYDPPWDKTWYVVKNPLGGMELELAVEASFDLAFGGGYWSFHPTDNEFARFCETVKAIIEGRGATVSFCVGEETKASAVLVGDELDTANDLALMERIAERDYYGTNQDIYWGDPYGLSRELKTKLRRFRSRNSWTARFEYFNPMQNESVGLGILEPHEENNYECPID